MRRCKLFLALMMIQIAMASASPWGKDADLAYRSQESGNYINKATPLIGDAAELLIQFHQRILSPADGPRSHYRPSSSQYTSIAMQKYGFFRGFLMGCDRLMRENDEKWIYPVAVGDYDSLIKLDFVP